MKLIDTMTAATPGERIIDTDGGVRVLAKDGDSSNHVVICEMSGAASNPSVMADAALIVAIPEMVEMLRECRLQIEYLHEKFPKTGTSETVLAKLDRLLGK